MIVIVLLATGILMYLMQPILRVAEMRSRRDTRPVTRADPVAMSMFVDRVLSGMRPTGRLHIGHYHGALKNWVKLQEEYECLYFAADWHALTTHYDSTEIDLRDRLGDVRRLARRRHQPVAGHDLHPVARARARRAHAAARHDHAGRLARARADLQGPAAEARRPRPVQLRVPRLPGDAGRRHPDLPREHGAGGRGPGVAHRARARARAPLQLHLRPRGGIRGQGQGGGQEARREEGAPLRRVAHGVPGKGRRRRARGGEGPAERDAEPLARRPRAAVRLSRRGPARDPARAGSAADRDAEGAGSRRPEDVEVASATRS